MGRKKKDKINLTTLAIKKEIAEKFKVWIAKNKLRSYEETGLAILKWMEK